LPFNFSLNEKAPFNVVTKVLELLCDYLFNLSKNLQLTHNFIFMALQSYMDSEIRAIMAQYMPLESQDTPQQRPVQHEEI
jgi:hypothetical protein